MESLIRGKYVVRGVTPTGDADLLEDAAILQRDGVIAEIGPHKTLASKYPGAATIGSDSTVVIPGFVNSHHHVGVTPFQLGAPDLPLETWLASRRATRAVDPYLDTLYSAFEMIASGVTTVQHIHTRPVGPVAECAAAAEQVLRAYADVGMRVSYSTALRDQNRLVYGPDDDFLRQLPPHLAKPLRLQLEHETAPIDDQLGMFEDLWHKWNARDRSRVQLAPANLHWVSDEGLRMVAERAVRFDVGIHIHLLETPYQKEYAHRRHGQSAVEHLRDLGLLDARTTLGHAVWVSEDEIELVAEMSALLCHNAGSNLRLQSGIAPLNEFLRRGILVGLGMDEAGINDDRDMLNEMRLVLNLHRAPGIGARVPTVAEVFRMATEQGARTTGFGPSIGRLDVGRSADTVLIDWEDLATPYLHEGVRVLDAILYRARSRTSVRAVTVAGEVIYENGSFTRLDRDVALAELTKSFNAPLRPEELERERIGRELLAHYADFYRDWTGPSGSAPFYLMNSRH